MAHFVGSLSSTTPKGYKRIALVRRMSRSAVRKSKKGRIPAKPWSFLFTLGLLSLIPPAIALLKALRNPQRSNLFLLWQIFLSLISFASYGFDKYRARTAGWRTREYALLLADALGGWPGGFAAQHCFRHKIRKTSFQFMFWVIVFLHETWWIRSLMPEKWKDA